MRRWPLLLLGLVVLACPPAACARLVAIAGADRAATFTDVSNGAVAQVALPGRARTVAVAPDGSRAWFGVGARVVPVDLASRQAGAPIRVGGRVTALAVSSDGARVYAARPGGIAVIGTSEVIHVDGTPRALAISRGGTRLAALSGPRIVVVDLERARVVRRVRLRASALAYSPRGALWVLAGRRLVALGGGVVQLGAGYGGGLAIGTDGRRAYVGAARGFGRTAIADLRTGRVRARIATGRGPGFPAVAPDGVRVYVANGGQHTIAVLSAVRDRRLGTQRLPASVRPLAIAVQPGLAEQVGTPGNDTIKGTRGDDRIVGLEGDDTLDGARGRDFVFGGPGNDLLDGGPSSDTIDGEDGDDRMIGGSGNDTITGGAGQRQRRRRHGQRPRRRRRGRRLARRRGRRRHRPRRPGQRPDRRGAAR